MFIDTHCHIHSDDYPDSEAAYVRAREAGVSQMICVGTDIDDSQRAINFANHHEGVFAAVGVHPHEAKKEINQIEKLRDLSREKAIAIGEIGLDYFYEHSPRKAQCALFEHQLQIAHDSNLPVIFHVRQASSFTKQTSVWQDFWPILANFPRVRGVLHSFTDTQANAEQALKKGLYLGINGIATFTKDSAQIELFRWLPLENIILETDAPYLTPVPLRGKLNEPAYVQLVAEWLSRQRNVSVDDVAKQTLHNATILFNL